MGSDGLQTSDFFPSKETTQGQITRHICYTALLENRGHTLVQEGTGAQSLVCLKSVDSYITLYLLKGWMDSLCVDD